MTKRTFERRAKRTKRRAQHRTEGIRNEVI